MENVNIRINDSTENSAIHNSTFSVTGSEKNGGKTDTETAAVQGVDSGVSIEISERAKKLYQDNERRSYMDQLAEEQKSAEAQKDQMNDLAKIIETARRIARGDKVPSKDEKKLIEYSSQMYQAAKAAAAMNEEKAHKKRKSLYDDDEEKDFEEKLNALNKEQDGSDGVQNEVQIAQAGGDLPGAAAEAPGDMSE